MQTNYYLEFDLNDLCKLGRFKVRNNFIHVLQTLHRYLGLLLGSQRLHGIPEQGERHRRRLQRRGLVAILQRWARC
jgi:hypothetical protein